MLVLYATRVVKTINSAGVMAKHLNYGYVFSRIPTKYVWCNCSIHSPMVQSLLVQLLL